jgi:hypothetical protein
MEKRAREAKSKDKHMRTKKAYPQRIKRIYRPELTECVECQSRLRRVATVSQRMVVTLSEVIQVVHCAYRCPNTQCPGHARLYRSTQADALALPGFTFGLDVVLLVGQLRLSEHKTVDEIHQVLDFPACSRTANHFSTRTTVSF